MTEEEMIARGQELYEACYGGLVPLPSEIDPKGHTGLAMKMFNDFWGDERLSFREKRLVVLGVLAGVGADLAFQVHAKSALLNGELGPDELRAALLIALPYAGYPRVSPLNAATDRLIAEHEKS